MGSIDDVLSRLDRIRHRAGGWVASCPAHDDSSPSLSVKEGEEAVVLHCFAGCRFDDIVDALGLTPADLFYEPLPPKREGTDLGRMMRELVQKTTPPWIDPGARIDDIMWEACVTSKLDEWVWAEAMAKATLEYDWLMKMEYPEAMRYRGLLKDGPLFIFLTPLWEHLGGADAVSWKDLAEAAFKKMAQAYRQYSDTKRKSA